MSLNNLDLKKVINASGRMSILGVSTLSDAVVDQLAYGAKNYFEMEELVKKSGEVIAYYLNAEAAIITNSASAAIALAVAGLITKKDKMLVDKLHDKNYKTNGEIIVMKGHNINYGAPVEVMIRLGGAEVKEVGYSNMCSADQVQAAITNETVGFLYVKSHHCVQKNMPSIDQVQEVCHRNGIPLLIDAAAEEDIHSYASLGDLVIFSGSKAIEGPTSGILAGKKQYIDYSFPHLKGIGRAMKVGKESIFGLLTALENYESTKQSVDFQTEKLKPLYKLSEIKGISVTCINDEAGRDICRGRIMVNEKEANRHAVEVVNELKNGEVAIYTRDYHATEGHFDIDPRSVTKDDILLITRRIEEIVGEAHEVKS
ncbi:DgaE family pyridoxal phosphate-dependent ammonia lyase [Sporosarcina sp. ANT_H38]|uniref:DgaE family pyridoxal phosphate-dependent ammonia lyase n=2 Tax=Sporosarcina sp. ANT_H38 TaxID=2597358 RepID=UPI00351A6ACE